MSVNAPPTLSRTRLYLAHSPSQTNKQHATHDILHNRIEHKYAHMHNNYCFLMQSRRGCCRESFCNLFSSPKAFPYKMWFFPPKCDFFVLNTVYVRCIKLKEYMKLLEYKRFRSLSDLCLRSRKFRKLHTSVNPLRRLKQEAIQNYP